MEKNKPKPVREIDKSKDQIIQEKIQENKEIGMLWELHSWNFEKPEGSMDRYWDFFVYKKIGSEEKMKGYLNFMDDVFDTYNKYLKKSKLKNTEKAKPEAKHKTLSDAINYCKKVRNREIPKEYHYMNYNPFFN